MNSNSDNGRQTRGAEGHRRLAVVIVNYNVKYYTEQCLRSLRKALEGIDGGVYVIDNHSKDGSVEYLKERFPEVTFIASSHNLGFARANNIVIRQTDSDYVLLLNPDTIVGESVLRECVAFMDTHEKAGALGVCMQRIDGKPAMESRRGLPTPMAALYKICGLCARYPESRRFGKYYMSYLPWDKPAKIEVVSGAFSFLRRAALDKTGLLDEEYFMYGEDIDLSYRLLKAGFDNWFLPSVILHYKGESTVKTSFRYVHVFYQAMLIFIRKHYGHLHFWVTLPIKAAIYCKATAAFFNMAAERVRKFLGFTDIRRPQYALYVFICRADTLRECRRIALSNGLEARFMEGDEHTMPDGHCSLDCAADGKTTYVVYDTSAFSYSKILSFFAARPCGSVFMGTYDPQTGKVITPSDVFQ